MKKLLAFAAILALGACNGNAHKDIDAASPHATLTAPTRDYMRNIDDGTQEADTMKFYIEQINGKRVPTPWVSVPDSYTIAPGKSSVTIKFWPSDNFLMAPVFSYAYIPFVAEAGETYHPVAEDQNKEEGVMHAWIADSKEKRVSDKIAMPFGVYRNQTTYVPVVY